MKYSFILLSMLCCSIAASDVMTAGDAITAPSFYSQPDRYAVRDSDSVQVYPISSPHQQGMQEIRVLTPAAYSPQQKYRVLYILPVGQGTRGSALRFFGQLGIHNKYNLVLAEMTFEKTPWFGNHATDTALRQENYVRDFVVPFVEQRYATFGSPEGRLLIGFSKSGWGAFSLILRNHDFFGYAAAWDTPWMLDTFHYKTDEVFGTLEQMDKYRPDLLVAKKGKYFKKKNRLVVAGEDIWGKRFPPPSGRSHTEEYHLLLLSRKIKHSYRPDIAVKHTWHKDWIEPVVKELMLLVDNK